MALLQAGSATSTPASISRHQGAPGAQALGELGPAALGAGGEQDQLHVQERRAAQRIVTAALGVRKAATKSAGSR